MYELRFCNVEDFFWNEKNDKTSERCVTIYIYIYI